MAKEFTPKDKEEFLKLKEWCIKHPIEAAMRIQELIDLGNELNEKSFNAQSEANSLRFEKGLLKIKNDMYKKALEKIATKKMSQYSTVRDMNNDFIKIANKALEEN